MRYEDQVIEAAKKGFNEGFSSITPELELLLRLVYRAGNSEGKRSTIEEQLKEIRGTIV